MRKFTLLLIVCFAMGQAYAQNYYGKQAQSIIPEAKQVKKNAKSGNIEFIRFDEAATLNLRSLRRPAAYVENLLSMPKGFTFKETKTFTDKLGESHHKYQQYYNGIQIEGMVYTLHYTRGNLNAANGVYCNRPSQVKTASLNYNQAFSHAKAEVPSDNYIFSDDKTINQEALGELVYIELDNELRLVYKFDIYSLEPLSRYYIYIDATNGEVVKKVNRIQNIDREGKAVTMYSDTMAITTDSISGNFRLRESGRGGGIETYDLNNGTSYSSAVDFIDADNFWDATTNFDNAAYDAHAGTEATYDYFFNIHGRNSYDNAGSPLISYVHYSSNYANAFWNGQYMTYGDGDGSSYFPLTCIDIVAHEITHGVTEHTANLDYSYESGALNESFSDIFGTCVDFSMNPSTANWLLGEQISSTGTPIRSLENPNDEGQPDTYLGTLWYTGSGDNGGVHYNSGVQNFWFYLLVNGGTGTNDNGDAYSVVGIGIENAAKIAYRNLSVYLSYNSQYADARFYSIQAAIDIFGECSAEVIAVTNAWHAVGVGTTYNNSIVAKFISSTYGCTAPFDIVFSNQSLNATAYSWDFGDGTKSVVENPIHTYSSVGTYSVTLIATGSTLCNVADTIFKQDLITITNAGEITPAVFTPSTLYPGTYGIYEFKLNTIERVSGGATEGCEDVSCSYRTSLIEGKRYPIGVTTSQSAVENVKVWIDLNNNGSFSASEIIYESNNSALHEAGIIIPQGIVYDTPLRLRVESEHSNYSISDTSSNPRYGQVEDYAVIILANTDKPEVNFSSDLQVIQPGESVLFSDITENIPTTWRWYLPGADKEMQYIQNPTVTYDSLGEYDVILVAENSFGVDSLIMKDYIKVVNTYIMCETSSTSATSGTLFDSGGPDSLYSNSEDCSFLIQPDCADSIVLSFNTFQLEGCCDYFKVYDGTDNSGKVLGTFYGATLPLPVIATSGAMFIHFTTDGSVFYDGFSVTWESKIAGLGGSMKTDFSASDTTPAFNTPVSFTDLSNPHPFSWYWQFNDGSISTEENPKHSYTSAGAKKISLISESCIGKDTADLILTVQDSPVFSLITKSINDSLLTSDSSLHYIVFDNTSGNGDLEVNLETSYLSTNSVNATGLNVNNNRDQSEILLPANRIRKLEERGVIINSMINGQVNYSAIETVEEEGKSLKIENSATSLLSNDLSGLNIAFLEARLIFSTELELKGANTFSTTYYSALLDSVDVIVIGDNDIPSIYTNEVNEWIKSGGCLIIDADQDLIVFDSLIAGSGIQYSSVPTLGGLSTDLGKHEILDTISSYSVTSGLASLVLTDKADFLVKDINGVNFAAAAKLGKGKVLAISNESLIYTEKSIQELGVNAVRWFNSGSSDWVKPHSESIVISQGEIDSVPVLFDASGLNGGLYEGYIFSNSNDLNNPIDSTAVTLKVTGIPLLGVTPADSIVFDTCYLNYSSEKELIIKNIGTDSLIIDSIYFNTTNYSINTADTILYPSESYIGKVQFNSTAVASTIDTLYIENNSSESIYKIPLYTVSILPPIMEVNPDSINILLNSGDSASRNIIIDNSNGLSELRYTINIEENKESNLSPSRISKLVERGVKINSVDNGQVSYTVSELVEEEGKSLQIDNMVTRALSNDLTGLNILFLAKRTVFSTEMELRGANTIYTSYNSNLLDSVDVIITADGSLSATYANEINQWIKDGGCLIIDADEDLSIYNSMLSGSGIQYSSTRTSEGLSTNLGKHEILDSITSYYVTYGLASLVLTDEANFLVKDINGVNYAAAAKLEKGKVLALSNETLNNTETNVQELGINAIRWFKSESSWLEVSKQSGIVAAGASDEIDVYFNASGLNGGDYYSNIIISSNDPSNSLDSVPVHLNVTGVPIIETTPSDFIVFDTCFINSTIEKELSIKNTGTETLIIDSIYFNSNSYSSIVVDTLLVPDQGFSNRIKFYSTAVASTIDTVYIANNSSHSIYKIPLYTVSILPPAIEVNPGSFDISLVSGETLKQKLSIENTLGRSNLRYGISLGEKNKPVLSPSRISKLTERGVKINSFINGQVSYTVSELIEEEGMSLQIENKATQVLSNDLNGSNIMFLAYRPIFSTELELRGANTIYTSYNSDLLDSMDVIIIEDGSLSSTYANEVNQWIKDGGCLIIDADQDLSEYNSIIEGSGIQYSSIRTSGGLSTNLGTHEILDSITSYYVSSGLASLDVSDKAEFLVKDIYGNIFAAAAVLGKGKVLAISDESLNNTNINNQELGINAVRWFQSGISWLDLSKESGILAAGSSQYIDVLFNAEGMQSGVYLTNLNITSNDPVSPLIETPVRLRVLGLPSLEYNLDSIEFGTVNVGDSTTQYLSITNISNQAVTITSISTDDAQFSTPAFDTLIISSAKGAIKSIEIPMVIDGEDDGEWSQIPSKNINSLVYGYIDNAADLSANWRAAWDDSTLYLIVNVTDNIKINDSPYPDDDDGVELYFDGDNSKGSMYDGVNDFQMQFKWGDPTIYTNLNNPTKDYSVIDFEMKPTIDGYIFECAIPLSILGINPNINSAIGFDIHINDDDNLYSKDAKLAWFASFDNSAYNPSAFGTVNLANNSSIEIPLTFNPSASGLISSAIHILSTDEGVPEHIVPIAGTGIFKGMQPAIAVRPLYISDTLKVGERGEHIINIDNTLGKNNLQYSISNMEKWVNASFTEGNISKGFYVNNALTLDAHGLAPGLYTESLIVSSNDVFNSDAEVEIVLMVIAASGLENKELTNSYFVNYPNPFSGITNIEFVLENPARVEFNIYNSSGIKVRAIGKQMYASGTSTIIFDGNNLPAGLYYIQLINEGAIQAGHYMLVK